MVIVGFMYYEISAGQTMTVKPPLIGASVIIRSESNHEKRGIYG